MESKENNPELIRRSRRVYQRDRQDRDRQDRDRQDRDRQDQQVQVRFGSPFVFAIVIVIVMFPFCWGTLLYSQLSFLQF